MEEIPAVYSGYSTMVRPSAGLQVTDKPESAWPSPNGEGFTKSVRRFWPPCTQSQVTGAWLRPGMGVCSRSGTGDCSHSGTRACSRSGKGTCSCSVTRAGSRLGTGVCSRSGMGAC